MIGFVQSPLTSPAFLMGGGGWRGVEGAWRGRGGGVEGAWREWRGRGEERGGDRIQSHRVPVVLCGASSLPEIIVEQNANRELCLLCCSVWYLLFTLGLPKNTSWP